jgi:hypothetical protein
VAPKQGFSFLLTVIASPSAALRINSGRNLVGLGTPSPDASPVRLARHDIPITTDQN